MRPDSLTGGSGVEPAAANAQPRPAAAPAADRIGRGPNSIALAVLVAAMLLVRLATLGSYPLMDTSEARYGEIARVMLSTGNFVTPQEIAGVPFWAKPPLYAWLAAGSMRLLGVDEFALRLPSFLCALAVLALCLAWSGSLAQQRAPPERVRAGVLTLALLSTSVLFFVGAGAVMTDPALVLCTTWMLAAFHHGAIAGSRSGFWRWGFFVAAGLGMLAKGPVIGLYAGAPIVLWTLWQRRVAGVWAALPWLAGGILAVAICAPWYLLAEERTPGFLRYFLLGEHVMRFLQPGWGGDLYGNAHAEPLGMIWAYLAGALGLSALVVGGCALAAASHLVRERGAVAPAQRFLLLAIFVPLVFFTFAGNIIWTYVLPMMGPVAVLTADFLAPRLEHAPGLRRAVYGTLIAAGLSVAIAGVAWVPQHVAKHSSAALVAQWRERTGRAPEALVYLGHKAPASLRFYTAGSVRAIDDVAAAIGAQPRDADRYLALPPERVDEVRRFAAAQPDGGSVEAVGANADLALVCVHGGARARP